MSKLPYTQFYVSDWLSDTAPLSPEARGLWIDLICLLWRADPRGKLSYPKVTWLRLLRVEAPQFEAILQELVAFRICNISCNASITIESRRIVREEKKRENNRIRVDKWRSNKAGNESVTLPEIPRNTGSNGENQKQSQKQKQKQSQNQTGKVLHTVLQDKTTQGFEPLAGLGEAVLAIMPKDLKS